MTDALVTSPGHRFAQALAAKDANALGQVLAADIDFRALTPRRPWEAGTSDEVVEIVFGSWFKESDHIEALHGPTTGPEVVDTAHVSYRLDVTNDDGPHVVEQQAYYRAEGDRISYLRILCSGYRPA